MKDNPLADETKALRLDKWLWYARFFKTRNMATRLIASGKLRLNGEVMSKPHRTAVVGQVLTFVQQTDAIFCQLKIFLVKIYALKSVNNE